VIDLSEGRFYNSGRFIFWGNYEVQRLNDSVYYESTCQGGPPIQYGDFNSDGQLDVIFLESEDCVCHSKATDPSPALTERIRLTAFTFTANGMEPLLNKQGKVCDLDCQRLITTKHGKLVFHNSLIVRSGHWFEPFKDYGLGSFRDPYPRQ
jgi:hypothetical protein